MFSWRKRDVRRRLSRAGILISAGTNAVGLIPGMVCHPWDTFVLLCQIMRSCQICIHGFWRIYNILFLLYKKGIYPPQYSINNFISYELKNFPPSWTLSYEMFCCLRLCGFFNEKINEKMWKLFRQSAWREKRVGFAHLPPKWYRSGASSILLIYTLVQRSGIAILRCIDCIQKIYKTF